MEKQLYVQPADLNYVGALPVPQGTFIQHIFRNKQILPVILMSLINKSFGTRWILLWFYCFFIDRVKHILIKSKQHVLLYLPLIYSYGTKNMSVSLSSYTTGSNPTGIYLFKVNNRNTRKRYEICSKLTIKIPERRQWYLYC